MEPNVAITFETRGFTYLKMGQWDLAIEDYGSALRLDPKLARALYGRGVAELKKGDTPRGYADIEAAKAIDAKIADDFAHYTIP